MIAERHWIPAAAALLMAAGLLACSTPAARVHSNRDVFQTYSEDDKALIRKGKVDVGFTQEMVRIAKGEPHREYTRTTDRGETLVWSYVQREYNSDEASVNVRNRDRLRESRYRKGRASERVTVREEREYEKLRIEFDGGKVSAIERVIR